MKWCLWKGRIHCKTFLKVSSSSLFFFSTGYNPLPSSEPDIWEVAGNVCAVNECVFFMKCLMLYNVRLGQYFNSHCISPLCYGFLGGSGCSISGLLPPLLSMDLSTLPNALAMMRFSILTGGNRCNSQLFQSQVVFLCQYCQILRGTSADLLGCLWSSLSWALCPMNSSCLAFPKCIVYLYSSGSLLASTYFPFLPAVSWSNHILFVSCLSGTSDVQ